MIVDGREVYVMVTHPSVAKAIHVMGAADRAADLHAGRNWRRVKREMRKVGLPNDLAKLVSRKRG